MSQYSEAKNFFEINMIKDFNSKKFEKITYNEIKFLQKYILKKNANILDVMCGYGRLGNELHKLGYENISGVDQGNFDIISQRKSFNFYNADFYEWNSTNLYDYCYSLYNSYDNYELFSNTLNKCNNLLKNKGILIIDIFSKEWRDKLPDISYRVIKEDDNEKVELFRYYDGKYEKSVYRVTNDYTVKEFSYSQCIINKQELLDIVENNWEVTITNSKIENTREDDQKHILILRKKV